jgi:hypothetical protein
MGLEKLKESPQFHSRFLFFVIKLMATILVFLVNTTVLPVLLLLAFSYRKCLDFLAHLVHGKELGKIVTPMSSLFATDDIYDHPKANVLVLLTLEGTLEMNRFREIFTNNVLNARDSDGRWKYPELKQCIQRWGGYYFWKDCPDFNLEEHVRLYKNESGSSVTDFDIKSLQERFVRQKWKRNQPLWEAHLVHNYEYKPNWVSNSNSGPHTMIIMRYHHTTGDGYSWLHLITASFCQKPNFKNALPTLPSRSLASRLLFWALLPLRGAWALVEMMMLHFYHFDWAVKGDPAKTEYFYAMSDQIPVKSVKEIKNHFRVSFASVLHSILAGVHRQMLQRKGFRLPKELPCWVTLPLPGHPLKMRNHL